MKKIENLIHIIMICIFVIAIFGQSLPLKTIVVIAGIPMAWFGFCFFMANYVIKYDEGGM